MEFPSPVGGVALPSDYAPSILFAVMYGILIPLIAYRAIARNSRNTLLIGTSSFVIERVVIFSLRAIQSHNEARRLSKGLNTYMQVTIGMGFIGIAQDLVNLHRVLLVKTTQGAEEVEISAGQHQSVNALELGTAQSSQTPLQSAPLIDRVDNPRLRAQYRRISGLLGLSFLAAIIPGVIGNSRYRTAIDDSAWATKVMQLRYASTSVALFLVLVMAGRAWWTSGRVAERRRAVHVIYTVCGLVTIVAIYRLSVMYHLTTSLDSTSPSSLNTPAAKATFYIFHMLPEWVAATLLLGCNTRQMFDTGPFGDWRAVDETPSQKQRRLAKQAKKAGRDGTNSQ